MSTAASPPVFKARLAVVVMGVSGAGKTTVGRELARRLDITFVDGDDLHPPANVAKMAAGTPLVDADRWPWLDRVGETLADAQTYAGGVVVACSALRRVYRDRIRAAASHVRFVYLTAGQDEIEHRLEARPEHFMPVALVASQFETLESPIGEPNVLPTSATGRLQETIDHVVDWLRSS